MKKILFFVGLECTLFVVFFIYFILKSKWVKEELVNSAQSAMYSFIGVILLNLLMGVVYAWEKFKDENR